MGRYTNRLSYDGSGPHDIESFLNFQAQPFYVRIFHVGVENERFVFHEVPEIRLLAGEVGTVLACRAVSVLAARCL